MTYRPLPTPSFVDHLQRVPRRGRKRWRNNDGVLYEYDSQHSELEMYNSRGRHLGVVDVVTGELIKPGIRGRSMDVYKPDVYGRHARRSSLE